MMQYYWEGVNRSGKKVSGNEKISRGNLERKLLAQGITILKIRLQFKNPHPPINKKIISDFTLEFYILLNSGIAIQQALQILANTHENKSISWLAIKISHKISQGISLSETFKSMPRYFNSVYCNMIYVGEQSGTLLEILQELIQMQTQLRDLRTKFWKAISYPAFVLLSTLVITSGLLIFVMPKFQEIFAQAKIPLPSLTQALITLSECLQQYWPLIFLTLISTPIAIFLLWKKNLRYAVPIEKMLFRIPLIGDFIQRSHSSRFAQILATTLRAGLPLSKALEISAPTHLLQTYQIGIGRALSHIKNGESFTSALKKADFLSKSVQALIAIGETAGRLDDMLAKIASMEQQELQNSIDVLSKWLEPVMMIILGLVVGGMIIAMYLPVFQMNSGG